MTNHPLWRRAFVFQEAAQAKWADAWIYDRAIGAWVDRAAPTRLMVDIDSEQKPQPSGPKPPPQPERPRPMSKKADVETGEDMKGA